MVALTASPTGCVIERSNRSDGSAPTAPWPRRVRNQSTTRARASTPARVTNAPIERAELSAALLDRNTVGVGGRCGTSMRNFRRSAPHNPVPLVPRTERTPATARDPDRRRRMLFALIRCPIENDAPTCSRIRRTIFTRTRARFWILAPDSSGRHLVLGERNDPGSS